MRAEGQNCRRADNMIFGIEYDRRQQGALLRNFETASLPSFLRMMNLRAGDPLRLNSLWEKAPSVIPNGVCAVRNLSFLGILIEEGFLAQNTRDGKPYLAPLGMTAMRIFQQAVRVATVKAAENHRNQLSCKSFAKCRRADIFQKWKMEFGVAA